MSKLLERTPNWPADDWASYYCKTWVLDPDTGKPVFIRSYGDSTLLTSEKAIPHSSFTWEHLKHPRLGWTLTSTGIPVYVYKKPLREKSKGMRLALLDLVIPPHIEMCVSKLQRVGSRGVEASLLASIDIPSLWETPRNSLSAGIKKLSAGEFAVLLSRDVLLTHNPNVDEYDKFPYLLAVGPALAGKVSLDESVEQVGDVDLSEVLYA